MLSLHVMVAVTGSPSAVVIVDTNFASGVAQEKFRRPQSYDIFLKPPNNYILFVYPPLVLREPK